jgi:hypothetical protein
MEQGCGMEVFQGAGEINMMLPLIVEETGNKQGDERTESLPAALQDMIANLVDYMNA